MTLRAARADEIGAAAAFFAAPSLADRIVPPDAEELGAAQEQGLLFLWPGAEGPVGFAYAHQWLPGVYSIPAIAVDPPGRGHGGAFLAALLDHLFDQRGAHRVGLDVTTDNAAALALYARLGFVREGTWRECWQRPAGDWVDCAFLAILRREWAARG